MKVAFVYFDEIHHVFHSASIALALSAELGSGHSVDLLTISDDCEALLKRMCAQSPAHHCRVRRLAMPLPHRLWGHYRRRFPRKSRTLKKHAALLGQYDAIVGTDMSTAKLQRYLGDKTPLLVSTKHGAGDRAYGYREDLRLYSLILASGPKVKRRVEAVGLPPGSECHISGYAKFDTNIRTYNRKEELFPQTAERKTVVYNPHFATHLSSWQHFGEQIMDYFAASTRYNLIFAPHIMLFDPRHGNHIHTRWKNLPHVHIDTGSLASSDMSYTRLADAYIGDVSSQVYEFMITPRPCIFLNAHGVDWAGDINYRSWQGGSVIERGDDVATQLERLLDAPPDALARQLEQQQRLLDDTFSLNPEKTASERAAATIRDFLQRKLA
ncbi:hypothetical protein Q4485_10960 [Granulosicoccaceae sp. 1_MG-2023]|nr:hypothetical protein [Granulosicoccaceae sp. 1_MG-2023]